MSSSAGHPTSQSNDATRTSQDQKTLDDFLAQETFKSITDMDEGDPNQEFSRGIVASFLDQASKTISEMKDLLGLDKTAANLDALARKGHYLKGSSATIGIDGISSACANIQFKSSEASVAAAKKDETVKTTNVELVESALKQAEKVLDQIKPLFEKYYNTRFTSDAAQSESK